MAACTTDETTDGTTPEEQTQDSWDVLTLSVDYTDIVLEETYASNTAVTLSWSTGTNYGSGNKIFYTLDLAKADTDFAEPYCLVDNAVEQYSWSATVEELNNLVKEQFGVAGGESIELEARVSATVYGLDDDIQESTVEFSVTTYIPLTTTLYIIGDATSGGWDLASASKMTRVSAGVFTWQGNLTEGNFKFVTTKDDFIPSYNSDGDGNLVYRASYDDPDEQFTISEEHYYSLTANLLTLTLGIEQTEAETPAFGSLYFADGDNWTAMTNDPLDPFLFRHGAVFSSACGFWFATVDGSADYVYRPAEDNASITSTGMEFIEDAAESGNQWYLQESEAGKAYKICVDIRNGKERMLMSEFTPYEEIWLVGDAAPHGWSLDDADPMDVDESNPYLLTWTGTLGTGELKFTCDEQSDWEGAWFMADEDEKTPTGETEHALFIDKSDEDFAEQYLDVAVSGVDQKWNIVTAGTYTITLNQLEETISIVYQGAAEDQGEEDNQ